MKTPGNCLTLIVLSAVCFLGMTLSAAADISIVPSRDVIELGKALRIPGGCTVTNITFSGADGSAGTFTDGPFGIGNGVILSSGGVVDALPPDSGGGTSTAFNTPGDPDLDVLLSQEFPGGGFTTHDAAVLTLTFDADSANCLSFELVFGSEEYPEYVGSSFNDVYGAFLNGVQVSFDQNGRAITINGPFFSSGEVVKPPLNGLEYDGSTGLLVTRAPLTPGSTGNVLKFAVADASDAILDSGVLLSRLTCQILPGSCATSTQFVEVCTDGIDNDDDGLVDKNDPDCVELCNDGADNDRDNRVDTEDPDCSVTIDIKPGAFPNTIIMAEEDIVPVAILTTSTHMGETVDFDAPTLVDPLSVRFGPAGAPALQGQSASEDVDGDGDLDLVLKFDVQATGIPCGNSQALLTGKTLAGQGFMGSDSVQAIKCPISTPPPTG